MNKLSLDWFDLQGAVSVLCREITNSNWKPDYVIGITRGGLIPAVMISHYFNVPCNTLKVCLRDNQDSESNLWMADDSYSGKNILLVDDINDSGATINWILNDWQSSCHKTDPRWHSIWGNTTRFAVLYDNLSSDAKIKVSYSAREINKAENDVWVDFPYESWWCK
jgi:hypoxanthine phosphoribosyltransferase